MADVGWENWSQFGKVAVSIDSSTPSSLTKTVAYQDTWHLAIGAQYRPAAAWLLSAGGAYDSSMMNESTRTVLTPIGAAWRFGAGVQWSISRSVALGLDDTFVWGGTIPLSQDQGSLAGNVVGQYPGTFMNFVAVNVRWLI